MGTKTKTKTRSSASRSSSGSSTSESKVKTLTARNVADAGGVTDELLEPFVDLDNQSATEQMRSSIASYCRYLDCINADERAAAMDVPIVTTGE